MSTNCIANLQLEMGDFEESYNNYNTAYMGFVKEGGENHPMCVVALVGMATCKLALEDDVQAKKYAEQAENILKKLPQDTHPKISYYYCIFGIINFYQDNYEKGINYLVEAIINDFNFWKTLDNFVTAKYFGVLGCMLTFTHVESSITAALLNHCVHIYNKNLAYKNWSLFEFGFFLGFNYSLMGDERGEVLMQKYKKLAVENTNKRTSYVSMFLKKFMMEKSTMLDMSDHIVKVDYTPSMKLDQILNGLKKRTPHQKDEEKYALIKLTHILKDVEGSNLRQYFLQFNIPSDLSKNLLLDEDLENWQKQIISERESDDLSIEEQKSQVAKQGTDESSVIPLTKTFIAPRY
jgi:tetratricopeptide (TPR) repeat protein